MSRVQPKFSATDRYAKQIARAIAKGRPPRFDADLESYCERSPREIFAAFAGAARHMPPAGKDQALALGYIFVLQRLLEHLRYRTDRGYADAARLIGDFQAELTRRTEAGELDGPILALLSGALHESKIPASPEFSAASAKRALDEHEDEPGAADPHDALAGIIEACGGHPFGIARSLLEAGHGRPIEHRAALVTALALDGNPQARSAAVLFLLDPEVAIRREVSGALGQVAASLTATDVRRVIAIRNWRPEQERAQVDAIVRKARAAGIECAQWEGDAPEAILATAIDGSEAQAFLMISPVGRKRRLSSILTRGGVAEAFSGGPEPRRRLEDDMEAMGAPTLSVSRQYVDGMMADHLARGIAKGEVPPFGLLEVAETIGGADWQPARKDFGETLAALLAEIPQTMRQPAAIASVLRRSGDLPDLEVIAEAWFEDDPEVAEVVQRAGGRDPLPSLPRLRGRVRVGALASYLLQSVIERRRDKWADLFLRTAVWMHEAIPEDDLCWRELALVAQAVAEGRDLNEIGLMRDIAQRTIEAIKENSGRV